MCSGGEEADALIPASLEWILNSHELEDLRVWGDVQLCDVVGCELWERVNGLLKASCEYIREGISITRSLVQI